MQSKSTEKPLSAPNYSVYIGGTTVLLVFAYLRWSLCIWNSHSVVVSLHKGDILAYIDIIDEYFHVPIYLLAPAVLALCGREGALSVCSLALWSSFVYLGHRGNVHVGLLSINMYCICGDLQQTARGSFACVSNKFIILTKIKGSRNIKFKYTFPPKNVAAQIHPWSLRGERSLHFFLSMSLCRDFPLHPVPETQWEVRANFSKVKEKSPFSCQWSRHPYWNISPSSCSVTTYTF